MTTTLALSSDTKLSKTHPNLKTISNQAADNVNAGETSVVLSTYAISSLDPSHGDCKLQFSTLVVARGNFTGNSRNNTEIVSKWNQATIAIIFILTYSVVGIF
ncbi:hypothetical protein FRX31_030989 [Thalictrum thalictroides]|uniref:Uncharacterized protein n=1 Tax=Thalictrum thalictroides TaxID=46969 RepID=A0A7J6V301_THATH|nr:hypothetical protein FRX31_030989 [Thalictrum thalictroides]